MSCELALQANEMLFRVLALSLVFNAGAAIYLAWKDWKR